MAIPFVTGPCGAFVRLSSTPVFLGHCERSPSVQIRPYYSPVFSDFAGQRVPLDEIYDGEDAVISLDLTRYNEAVYTAMAARPSGMSPLGPNAPRGANAPGDIGSLMLLEGYTFDLWLTFPYAAKAVFSSGATGGPMPAGYHMPACYLEGPDDLGPLGTTARRLRLNFHALRTFASGSAGTVFSWYDHDMSAVAGRVQA
jgi:hypothetical protein